MIDSGIFTLINRITDASLNFVYIWLAMSIGNRNSNPNLRKILQILFHRINLKQQINYFISV